MYHYVQDKEFVKRLKCTCSDIVNQLVQRINSDSFITAKAYLVGSGAKNLITQNKNNPIDFDYNLCVEGIVTKNGYEIKEYVRKQFNKVLKANGWGDCQDSTSALTTEKRVFKQGNKTAFSIDIAITCKNNVGGRKLIHEKTGFVNRDRYYWNEVRDTYLQKKNIYLRRNDDSHPSFIVYIETVNQIYYKYI